MDNEVSIIQEERSIKDVEKQVVKIQELMRSVMRDGEHFGKVPGCGDKPTLLKPGAEKLCFTFRVVPEFDITEKNLDNLHREYQIKCRLKTPNGQIVGEGIGSCSTMETKYRYRNAAKKCPMCGAETIITGKKEYGGGFLCYGKKGGCGAKFGEDDPAITKQPVGKVENPDIADTYNTVLKMAKKRAHVDATITTFAASDIFTQDVEDFIPDDIPTTPTSTTPPAGNKIAPKQTPRAPVEPESDGFVDDIPGDSEQADLSGLDASFGPPPIAVLNELARDKTPRGFVKYARVKHEADLSEKGKALLDRLLYDKNTTDAQFDKAYDITQTYLADRGIAI